MICTLLGENVISRRQIWANCVIRGIQGAASRNLALRRMERDREGDAPSRRSSRLLAKCSNSSAVVFANRHHRRYATDESVIAVEHDPKSGHFYIEDLAPRAYLEYERDGQLIRIMHTEVPPELEGRGLGKILAKAALEYVAKNDLPLEIECDFVRHFVTKYEPKYIKYLQD